MQDFIHMFAAYVPLTMIVMLAEVKNEYGAPEEEANTLSVTFFKPGLA